MADKDVIADAMEAFKLVAESEQEMRRMALDDLRFARLSEQWPEEVRMERNIERRPCLTINKLPSFIRQIVNEARRNKFGIQTLPIDDKADPKTAEIIDGLIRNIQSTSDADTTFINALDFAVTMGFAYWRVKTDYAMDDSFDMDLLIAAIPDPFSVYGDPFSMKMDSSDWNSAFIVEPMSKDRFKKLYKSADQTDWQSDYVELQSPWLEQDSILVAEWWTREEQKKEILLLSDNTVIMEDVYKANRETFDLLGLQVINNRMTKSWKVMQKILSGAEVLETNDWAGRYIPIVPVYGESMIVEGQRHLKGMVRDSMDSQRMFNYWRTASTELVALAPKAPFIGPKGAFKTDRLKWETANNKSHPYIEFDGSIRPERQPFAGVPAGALQEALNASDDIKAIIGIYDAALGARSNETSGRAILARQQESNISTYHFIDNYSTSLEHTGRILIDMIPHVFSGMRIARILGGDDGMRPENVQLNAPFVLPDGTEAVYDVTVGKYDCVVKSGPSFQTQREEASEQMLDLLRSFPQAAPLVGDLLVKKLDWPGADEISKRLKTLLPPNLQGDEENAPSANELQMQQAIEQMQQQMQQGIQFIQSLQEKIKMLEEEKALEARKLDIDAYNAETKRIDSVSGHMTKPEMTGLIVKTLVEIAKSPDILNKYTG